MSSGPSFSDFVCECSEGFAGLGKEARTVECRLFSPIYLILPSFIPI